MMSTVNSAVTASSQAFEYRIEVYTYTYSKVDLTRLRNGPLALQNSPRHRRSLFGQKRTFPPTCESKLSEFSVQGLEFINDN